MKSFSLIFIVLFQLCTNDKVVDEEIFVKRDSIIGKWQLFETCISPGAACILEKIKNGMILEFKENGEYLISNVKENDGIYQCNGNWKIIESVMFPGQKQIQISPSCNKALWTLNFGFNSDNTLNINPQCIEECRYTYKPIN